MDPAADVGRNIVLQTNIATEQSPLPSPIAEANNETNGKHSPAVTLSPSSIILSPCDNERPNNGTNTTDEEFDEVKRFFDKKLHVIEKWLRDRASPEIQTKLHDATDYMLKSPKLRTSSVTSDLFQQWLASSPIQVWLFFCCSLFFLFSFFVFVILFFCVCVSISCLFISWVRHQSNW